MKLVAIGGGSNSNIRRNGEPKIYEHEAIDKEIISLSGKSNPNVLYISHGNNENMEEIYYRKTVNSYGKMYNCPVKLANREIIHNYELNKQLVDWADIIYIGGGNAEKIFKLWKQNNYIDLIYDAAKNGKIICGLSAGSNILFNYSCSKVIKSKPQYISMPAKGIGLINLATKSHAKKKEIEYNLKIILGNKKINLLFLSNNMALKVVDEKYEILEGYSSDGLPKIAALGFWKDEKYCIENIKREGLLEELINK